MKNLFFLFVLFFGTGYSQIWTSQTSGVTDDLYGVWFTDANNGIACGDNGVILKTTDAGASWNSVVSGTTNHLKTLAFPSASIGYVVGAEGTILKTTDGGSTWSSCSIFPPQYLYGVSFINNNIGTVVGADGIIYSTTDGGLNWSYQCSYSSALLTGVVMKDVYTIIAVGQDGSKIVTYDGGMNWYPGGTSGSLLNSIIYTHLDSWIIVGNNGTIQRSTNDGASWTTQIIGTTSNLRDLFFTSPNNGVIVGENGLILKTLDGGANWSAENSGVTGSLLAVHFPDATHGFAVGAGGTILHYAPSAFSAPVATAASGIQSTAFNANWNASANANSYKLDVASDASFNNLLTGYSGLDVGNVTTYLVNTGLTAGAQYWYRLRAYNNSGESGNSNDITLITLPAAAAAGATSIGRYGVTLNWSAVAGAADYIIDVANNSSFTSFVTGYQALSVGNVTTFNVTGLVPGFDYYCRVRAVNASGSGANSNTITVNTLPPSADLALTSSVDKPNPKNLEILTYNFTITNSGPDTAKAVTLYAAIPRGFLYSSSNATNSTYSHATNIWSIPVLAPNASAGLTVIDTVDYFNQAYDFRDFYETNVFVKSDADFVGVNIGGKLAVRNNAFILGSDIGGQLRTRPASQDVVVVRDTLIFQSGAVHYGNVVYDLATNLPNANVVYPNGALVQGNPLDFDGYSLYLNSLSSGLAVYNVNGTTNINSGNITLTGSDIYLNVFNVNGTDFAAAPLVTLNVPKGSVAIVNVLGAAVDFSGNIDIQNNVGNFVLFNFPQATALNITGSSFYGSILAPFAEVQATGSLFRGQLFANRLASISAHQNHSFLGYIPLNRTIAFLPVVTSSFSIDLNAANNNNPAVVTVNTTAPYGTAGTGTWSVASVLPVNEMVISMTRLNPTTILAGTNLGKIYRMDNSGVLDTVAFNASMTPAAYIHNMAVNDSGHVFAATESGLYRTTNGGATWINHMPGVEVRAILIGSGGHIYAGTWSFGVYRSDDNGYTWVQKNDNIGSTVVTSLMDRTNNAPQYSVFAGTIGAGVAATFNYANNWLNLAFPYEFITCMDKTSEGILFVGTLADGVYRSYDNGNTWTKMAGIPNGPIYAIRIDGQNNIFVSSWMFGIYGSANLGDNWTYIGLGGYGISATFPGPDNKLFASCAGKILLNNSALTSAKPANSAQIPANFAVEQNFPNPFNPATVIKFSLPSSEKVTLKIYNAIGKEVAALLNSETKSAGYHQVTFNASQLASGVYFYRLQAGKYSVSKKMLLLK